LVDISSYDLHGPTYELWMNTQQEASVRFYGKIGQGRFGTLYQLIFA